MKRPGGFQGYPAERPPEPAPERAPRQNARAPRQNDGELSPTPPAARTDLDETDVLEPLPISESFLGKQPAPVSEQHGPDAETQKITPLARRKQLAIGASHQSDALAQAKRELRHAKRRRKQRERSERRRFTQFSRERRNRLLLGAGAVVALGIFVWVGLFTPLMSVRTIEVEGAERLDPVAVIESLSGLNGTPLALVDEQEVFTSLESFSLIQSFAVESIPPSTLRVVITERTPIIAVMNGEEAQLLDAAGVVIERVSPDALPETIPLMRESMGPESARFLALTTMVRALPESLLTRVVEVSAETPQQLTLLLDNGLSVVWGDAKDNVKKATVLDSMLTALGDREVSGIDLSSHETPVFVP